MPVSYTHLREAAKRRPKLKGPRDFTAALRSCYEKMPNYSMSLTLAARRGVAVDLLLPQKSNHRLADLARHRALRELVAAGAKVHFLPRMIHAKAIAVSYTHLDVYKRQV